MQHIGKNYRKSLPGERAEYGELRLLDSIVTNHDCRSKIESLKGKLRGTLDPAMRQNILILIAGWEAQKQ